MKKLKATLVLLLVIQTNAMTQQIDAIKIETVLNDVLHSFRNKSFTDFEQLLFDKEDYLALAKQIQGNPKAESDELETAFQEINGQIKARFIKILKKGEDKGINWEEVSFAGYVFNSDELMIGNETKDEGFLVDSHLRLRYKDKIFTIVGIQLWLFGNAYKVKGDELRGIYEIDLNTYVPTDDLYLDEMDETGY